MFQQKILCLGNNSQDTDVRTGTLANKHSTVNHGLIDHVDFFPADPGYYHTTVIDLSVGAIHNLAKQFDMIVLLDQPLEQWSNWKLLNISYKLIRDLEQQGHVVDYRHNDNTQTLIFFDTVLKTNPSFCIHPWINFTEENSGLKLCPRDRGSVLPLTRMDNWSATPAITQIQQKMLAGEKIPSRCGVCYEYEDIGTESYRQFETLEWLLSLNIKSFEDLDRIKHPYLYEVRLNNKCNIMCRSCNPHFSHLIAQEAEQHKIKYPVKGTIQYSNIDRIDIDTLQANSRVYLTGGEPSIMPEVIEFLRRCVAKKHTDFELTLGTNGVKFSATFVELCKNFSNLNFSFSLDGYKEINNYWRWGSNWEAIVANMHLAQDHGHRISVNTVPGIYNVTNLHLLFEWLDLEFPMTGIYLQFNHFKLQSAFNHPNHDLVMESMRRCQQTRIYLADGKSTRSGIDSLYNHYSQRPQCDLDNLRAFFEFNDRLDQVRGSSLALAIPELEACRHLVQS